MCEHTFEKLKSQMQAPLVLCVGIADPSLVKLPDGSLVRGRATERFRSFRGLPFAAPPVGKLRWAPPQPAQSWHGELNATEYRHNCLQAQPFDPLMPRDTLSEDCLYLNVWTPPNATEASSLPVLFWVHGGSYQHGGANESRLNGTFNAADLSVIMVTTNYRLGIFGFLASSERAALTWVRTNIAAFGGDPARVLLVGESAGGASVYNHLARPASWGLFASAAAESGAYTFALGQPREADFESTYALVLRLSGCEDIACLEALDGDRLVAVMSALGYEQCTLRLQPVIDGVDLVAPIERRLGAGLWPRNVSLIAGSTREDLGYPLWNARDVRIEQRCPSFNCTQDDLVHWLAELSRSFEPPWLSAADQHALLEAYAHAEVALPGGDRSKWYWAARHMGSDVAMGCTARRSAAWAHAAGLQAFVYQFAHAPDGPSGAYPALAHHASEIPFVFRVTEAHTPRADADRYHISAREAPLALAMAKAWTHLASDGVPTPDWPAYTAEPGAPWMVFGSTRGGASATRAYKEAACNVWDRVGMPEPSAALRQVGSLFTG